MTIHGSCYLVLLLGVKVKEANSMSVLHFMIMGDHSLQLSPGVSFKSVVHLFLVGDHPWVGG